MHDRGSFCCVHGLELGLSSYAPLHKRMLAAMLHYMWLTCCAALCCRLLTNGLPCMGLQPVRVHEYAWPRLWHALCMVWDFVLQSFQ